MRWTYPKEKSIYATSNTQRSSRLLISIMDCESSKSEIPFETALRSLCVDETLSDVKFQGTDGMTVLGCRALLAGRSPVFRSMLYGDFLEAKQDNVITVQFDSKVIRFVVLYCQTNVEDLENADPHDLVAFLEASDYFGLDALKEKARAKIIETMQSNPKTVCFFLAEAGSVENIHSMAVGLIKKQLEFISPYGERAKRKHFCR
jgi:hypothetical protein